MTAHTIIDNDPRNPHAGDCVDTLCPACGCCMHCIPGACGCTITDQCADPRCQCPAEPRDAP